MGAKRVRQQGRCREHCRGGVLSSQLCRNLPSQPAPAHPLLLCAGSGKVSRGNADDAAAQPRRPSHHLQRGSGDTEVRLASSGCMQLQPNNNRYKRDGAGCCLALADRPLLNCLQVWQQHLWHAPHSWRSFGVQQVHQLQQTHVRCVVMDVGRDKGRCMCMSSPLHGTCPQAVGALASVTHSLIRLRLTCACSLQSTTRWWLTSEAGQLGRLQGGSTAL